jgi:integrase
LTGARDGALASFRLKHIDMTAQTLFQDAREVRTKGRKNFTSIFFPVGPQPLGVVGEYVSMLKADLNFSDDDALFPSTQIGRGDDRGFIAQGLSRTPWSGAGSIRKIFRDAFGAANLPYAKPHSFRDTSVLVSECAGPLRNGRFGARILDMKTRARHLSAMAKCQRIGTQKSCNHLGCVVSAICQPGWTLPP